MSYLMFLAPTYSNSYYSRWFLLQLNTNLSCRLYPIRYRLSFHRPVSRRLNLVSSLLRVYDYSRTGPSNYFNPI